MDEKLHHLIPHPITAAREMFNVKVITIFVG